jgi:hypothetical protein
MKIYSTPAVIFKVDQVDEENGILSKVIIAGAGKVKSHFGSIDQTTLSQFQQIGNAKEHGIKARFGHPNMCSSSYGIYIGRFKNFQMISDCLYADFHLYPYVKIVLQGIFINISSLWLNTTPNCSVLRFPLSRPGLKQ